MRKFTTTGSDALQVALDRLAVAVSQYGLCNALIKCKVLIQDWSAPHPELNLGGDRLEVVEKFLYLGSCISANGSIDDEVSMRISKARLAFDALRHLWRRRVIRLDLKGRIYCATVRAVLLYGSETWPLRTEDVRRLSVFDNRCLRRTARVW